MDFAQFKTTVTKQIKQGIVPQDSFIDPLLIKAEEIQRWWKNLNFHGIALISEDCEEIIFQGIQKCFKKEKLGFIELSHALKDEDLQIALELLALKAHSSWNFTSPFASFYANLEGVDFRISLIHHSCSPDNTSRGFFRVLSSSIRSIEDFCDHNTSSIIKELISNKKNTLICGATGSGKTTFLSSTLSNFNPMEHHLIIEDTLELSCSFNNVTRLLAENNNAKDMKSYLTYGMRMSPDRIILGELRSSEVISFLLALNTGHRGCWSTIHANSSLDAIDRLCLLFNLFSDKPLENNYVHQLICNALDYIIFLKDKKVVQVTRIINYHNGKVIHENLNDPLYYSA